MNSFPGKLRKPFTLCPCLVIVFIAQVGLAQIAISPNHENGLYQLGDTIKWQVSVQNPEEYDSLRYVIKSGALQEVTSGRLQIKNKSSDLSYLFEKPGSVILEIRWGNSADWSKRIISGGICAPGEIDLSGEKPADFEEFWYDKIKELENVPMSPIIQEEFIADSTIYYGQISMDNIRNSKITGQIAWPRQGSKFPALLIVQWAGVYPLQKDWVTNRAQEGWLALNINPHDLPIDKENEFYSEQAKNELKNYWSIGNDHRDSSYFLRMYLSCYRAVDFLKKHSHWNGQIIAVTGDSQGGMQALMVAGLHPDIDAAMALVPAGIDMLGPEVNRKGGWPQWYQQVENKDSAQVRDASRYFDVANFVSNIKCPVLVGVGLLDETCPAEGIIAGMNQIPHNKEIVLLPLSQHQDRNGSQAAYRLRRDEYWLPKLKAGLNPLNLP